MTNTKLIVFDLDGTFYDLNDVIGQVYDCQVSFFCKQRRISPDVARDIFTEHGILPYACAESKSCTEYFESVGVSKDEWASYRESRFDVMKIDVTKAVDPSVLRKFAATYSIYLLSSNTHNTIKKILSRLEIDADLFSGIVSSDRFVSSNKFNKREAMAAVIGRAAVNPKDALSIGDRYNTDILPMLELGGRGVLVKSPHALGPIYESLTAGTAESCEEFAFYGESR